jgi:hypothetical protein
MASSVLNMRASLAKLLGFLSILLELRVSGSQGPFRAPHCNRTAPPVPSASDPWPPAADQLPTGSSPLCCLKLMGSSRKAAECESAAWIRWHRLNATAMKVPEEVLRLICWYTACPSQQFSRNALLLFVREILLYASCSRASQWCMVFVIHQIDKNQSMPPLLPGELKLCTLYRQTQRPGL